MWLFGVVCVQEFFRATFKGGAAYETRMGVLERVGGAGSPEQLVRETLASDDVPKLEAFAELLSRDMLRDAPVQAAFLRRLIQLDEAADGRLSRRALSRRVQLGKALQLWGKVQDAERVLRPVADACVAELGPDDVDTLACFFELGYVELLLGRHAEAEMFALRVVAGREVTLGEDHKDTLEAMCDHAIAVARQPGRVEEAELLHRRVLAARERVFGEDHLETLQSVGCLAESLRMQQRHTEAEALCKRQFTGLERALGESQPTTVGAEYRLASCIDKQGRNAEAEQMMRSILAKIESARGADDEWTLDCVFSLAVCLGNQRRFDEAEGLYQRALKGYTEVLGAQHPSTQMAAHRDITISAAWPTWAQT